jgi:hypothetical protein
LSSHILTENTKIKMYSTIILLVILYGCRTWSLILRKNIESDIENRVLDLIGSKLWEPEENCIMRSYVIPTTIHALLGSNQGD